MNPSLTGSYSSITLADIVGEFGPLPKEATILGIATDGLPILHNSRDNAGAHVLIEYGIPVLKTVEAHLLRNPRSDTLVISDNQAWENAVPFSQADDAMKGLVSWAYGNRSGAHAAYLLLDGLEKVFELDHATIQDLAWLLLRGASKYTYVLASYEAWNNDMDIWDQYFGLKVRYEPNTGLYSYAEHAGIVNFWTPQIGD